MIQNRIKEGAFVKDSAAELNVSPKTISRAIKRGSAPTGKPGRPTESKLNPLKGRIEDMLGRHIWNAQVIFRELQAVGYTGGYSVLGAYVRPKRVLRLSKATVQFKTAPGRQPNFATH
jgi:transposase